MAAEARLRAMLPRRTLELQGSAAVADQFQTWFGDADEFEVVDASIGAIGGRLHLSWRLRVRSARADHRGWDVVEQQAYADTSDCIETLDLLCSGFHPEAAMND